MQSISVANGTVRNGIVRDRDARSSTNLLRVPLRMSGGERGVFPPRLDQQRQIRVGVLPRGEEGVVLVARRSGLLLEDQFSIVNSIPVF